MKKKLQLLGALPLYIFLLFHEFAGLEYFKIPVLIILGGLIVYRAKVVFAKKKVC